MTILERLDEEAREMGHVVHVHLLLDSGFYNFRAALLKRVYTNLKVTVRIPNHWWHQWARTPQDKRRGCAAKVLLEGTCGREQSSRLKRWVNEWEVGSVKHACLFRRLLDLTILPDIDNFFAIHAALVNYDRGVQPAYDEDDQSEPSSLKSSSSASLSRLTWADVAFWFLLPQPPLRQVAGFSDV